MKVSFFVVRLLQGLAVAAAGFSSSLAFGQATWQLIEVTQVSLPSLPQFGLVCSTYDASVCSNVSPFYRFRERHLRRVTAVGTLSEDWGIRASVTSGASAPKLTIDPRVVLGIIRSKRLPQGRFVSGEVYGSVGGAQKHIPCLDEYDREYFCGSLTAWTDFPDKRISPVEYGFKVNYRY